MNERLLRLPHRQMVLRGFVYRQGAAYNRAHANRAKVQKIAES